MASVSFVSSAITQDYPFNASVDFVFSVVGCTLKNSQQVSIVHVSGDNSLIRSRTPWIIENAETPYIQLFLSDNETLSDREETFSVTVLDTDDNSYTLTGKVIQYWGIYTREEHDPSRIWWDTPHPENSGGFRTYMTISAINCTFVDVASASIEPITGSVDYPGSWSTLPVSSVTFHNQTAATVYYDCPANDDDEKRWCNVSVIFNTNPPPRYEYSGISYQRWSMPLYQAAGSGTTPTPSNRWMYLYPDDMIKISAGGSEGYITVKSSGCSIDSSHTPTVSFKTTDFESGVTWATLKSLDYFPLDECWGINWRAERNTGPQRETLVLVDGVYDTDGNVYNSNRQDTGLTSLIYAILQYEGEPDRYIRFANSAVTMNSGWETCPLEASGCTPSSWGICAFSATGNVDIFSITQYGYICAIAAEENTGATPLESDVRVELYDTSGNTYYDTIHVVQAVQTRAYFAPDNINVSPGATTASTTAVGFNCVASSVTFNQITYSGGTWPVEPTFTINGTEVTFQVPENTGNQSRNVAYQFTITDTNGNTYTAQFYIGQAGVQVYLDPSGRTHAASAENRTYFYIRSSGCSIDSSYTPTFTFSGDTTFIDSIYRVTYGSERFTASYNYSRNFGDSDREVYITVNGVHDTDGHVYDGLVYHATQGWSAYTFLNYDSSSAPSAASVDTIEVVPVNTTICSVSFVSSASNTPDLWTGVTQPTLTILGNYITVNWPENPYQENRRLKLSFQVVWGESCEKTTTLTYTKGQNAAATPVQKDIEAEVTDYSVDSGSGNGSTTVQASGCTYDHFTYITGGSFSVTATSGPNNTIIFTYPQNPTTSQRTGYVYITFYDSDGNTYGPQTITFTQQAGSSPGPGPEPETGYVLTTLTISDQEQHRYFVEARPGIVYSAAGQYYKTVPACEARYSLYYVNSYGGVDVLPFKEKSWKKSDTVTRFNYSRSFRNNTLEFENVNYMNEIKASWELHTGWMSDESSQRMHELVESTIVYLYDAEEKTYTPVVMTDKKLEYKTYRNQGRKFYNYTINVEESQSRERR